MTKPRNFPGRKLARQIAAELRERMPDLVAGILRDASEVEQARVIRTKKRRAAV